MLWRSLEAPRTLQTIQAAVIEFRGRSRQEIAPRAHRLASVWGRREDIQEVTEDLEAETEAIESEPELQMDVVPQTPTDGDPFLASTPPHAIMVLKLAVQVLLEEPKRAIVESEVLRRMATWTAGSRNTLLWKVRQPVETRLLEPASGAARA